MNVDNLTTAPTSEPISLTEAKDQLRVSHTDDDSYIANLIKAGRTALEGHLRRAFITQTRTITRDNFPANRVIRLSRSPVQSVTEITYIDTSDTEQTLSTDYYQVDTESTPARVVLKDGYSWPSVSNNANNVTIVYVTGYGTASAVPDDIKLGLQMLVAHWYTARKPVEVAPGLTKIEIPKTIDYLLLPYKVYYSC